MAKIQFILKRKEDYNGIRDGGSPGLSTGLYNSASFVVDMLKKQGHEVELVVVTDNNDIDRNVTRFKPTHVIIEALWVVPEKFEVLTRLHPKVSWFIRLHSATPFISQEGIAMEWISKYVEYPNVRIMANDPSMLEDTVTLLSVKPGWTTEEARKYVIYTPNYYPVSTFKPHRFPARWAEIHVGCFGAIRPLKNQLIQAIAAIQMAKKLGKRLVFHINGTRVEGGGNPTLKNLVALFEQAGPDYELVMHPWMSHEQFLDVLYDMDVNMQVSFTETFNIVSADAVAMGVPVVTSSTIPWTYSGIAKPLDTDSITSALISAYRSPKINVFINQLGLRSYCFSTERVWRKIDWYRLSVK